MNITKTGNIYLSPPQINNIYTGKQFNCANGSLTYNYQTDIFKDYGFYTCTKLSANNSDTTNRFMSYSYLVDTNVLGTDVNKEYTFSFYAYISSDCNANLRVHLEHSNTWISNYQGTKSNINDITKGKVIWCWGRCRTSPDDGKIYIMLYPNPNQINVFTQGYILFTGMTIYEGTKLIRPVSQTGLVSNGFTNNTHFSIGEDNIVANDFIEY